jgi:hypothetical protein
VAPTGLGGPHRNKTATGCPELTLHRISVNDVAELMISVNARVDQRLAQMALAALTLSMLPLRVQSHRPRLPVNVCEQQHQFAGFALARQHRNKGGRYAEYCLSLRWALPLMPPPFTGMFDASAAREYAVNADTR